MPAAQEAPLVTRFSTWHGILNMPNTWRSQALQLVGGAADGCPLLQGRDGSHIVSLGTSQGAGPLQAGDAAQHLVRGATQRGGAGSKDPLEVGNPEATVGEVRSVSEGPAQRHRPPLHLAVVFASSSWPPARREPVLERAFTAVCRAAGRRTPTEGQRSQGGGSRHTPGGTVSRGGSGAWGAASVRGGGGAGAPVSAGEE